MSKSRIVIVVIIIIIIYWYMAAKGWISNHTMKNKCTEKLKCGVKIMSLVIS